MLALDHTQVQTAGVPVAARAPDAVVGAVVIDGLDPVPAGHRSWCSALLAVLTMAERDRRSPAARSPPQASAVPGSPAEAQALRVGLVQTEVFPLLLFSVGGMLLFPAANDLLTMFVALEVLSLPLYLMCGLARRRRLLSQEAALKYFLLGAFSSAFFLFGAALLYGFAGSVRLSDIAAAITGTAGRRRGARPGRAAAARAPRWSLVGLLFKVSAAPFHSWTPDVYQGAPTPVTGFMAACTKVAAFGALLRIAYVALPSVRWDWQPALWGVAILTMVVGSVIAIVQTDVKRMLAYSSIAHAGFLLTGVIAMDRQGVSGVLFYLLAYGFTTIGAFAVVTLVRDAGPDGAIGGEATHLSQWAGLGRRHPWIAGTFTLFLLAFAGHPADQRVHGQVRGVRGRGVRRGLGAGPDRCAGQRDRGVLLRPGDRADVLQRADRRRAGRVVALPGCRDHLRRRGRGAGDRAARRRAVAGPRPGRQGVGVPAMNARPQRCGRSARVVPAHCGPRRRRCSRDGRARPAAARRGQAPWTPRRCRRAGLRVARSSSRLHEAVEQADRLADDASRHLVLAGGKRVRPMLTLLASHLGDPTRPRGRGRRRGGRADPPGHACTTTT